MKKFSQHSQELDEKLDQQARFKLKASMKRNKAKIAAGKKKAESRVASKEKLMARARKQARTKVEKSLLNGRSRSDLSFQEREAIEKKLEKKKGVIDRLAKKMLPAIVKAEKSKKSKG
jgi:hypothetical protein